MIRFLTMSALLVGGCQSDPPAPQNTEVTRVCARAYGSTQAQLDKLVKEAGLKEAPPLPDKDEFVQLCEQLSLEAARCLDPVRQGADPKGCEETLSDVPEKLQKELESLFKKAQGVEDEAEEGEEAEAGAEEAEAGEVSATAGTEAGEAAAEATEAE